jgi:hypothetical protein
MTPQEHLPADDCQNTKMETGMDRHPGPENSEKRQKSEAKRLNLKSAGVQAPCRFESGHRHLIL